FPYNSLSGKILSSNFNYDYSFLEKYFLPNIEVSVSTSGNKTSTGAENVVDIVPVYASEHASDVGTSKYADFGNVPGTNDAIADSSPRSSYISGCCNDATTEHTDFGNMLGNISDLIHNDDIAHNIGIDTHGLENLVSVHIVADTAHDLPPFGYDIEIFSVFVILCL
ncbi:hypothetical protein U1Q18_039805, partial [Sarracenia purpurea var. burkii]